MLMTISNTSWTYLTQTTSVKTGALKSKSQRDTYPSEVFNRLETRMCLS